MTNDVADMVTAARLRANIAAPDEQNLATFLREIADVVERQDAAIQAVLKLCDKYAAWKGGPDNIGPLHGAGMVAQAHLAAEDFRAALSVKAPGAE